MSVSDQLNNDANTSSTDSNTDNTGNTDNINSSVDNQGAQNDSPLVLNDQLKTLIGDGKKYSTAQAALDSVGHAQDHIKRLEAELAEGKKPDTVDDKSTGMSKEDLDAILERMNGTAKDTANQISPDEIKAMITGAISTNAEEETAKGALAVAEANQNTFTKHLNDKFGKEALNTYNAMKVKSGLSEDKLDSLIRSNPDFVMSLLPAQQQQAQNTASTTNTAAFQAQGSAQQWSKEWITDIRRSDPKRYASTSFQMEMITKNASNK